MPSAKEKIRKDTMKFQPDSHNYVSDDCVQTPIPLAKAIVWHFKPNGLILEPCKGEGNFLYALQCYCYGEEHVKSGAYLTQEYRKRFAVHAKVDWCEIKEGRDFLQYSTAHKDRVEWLMSNPPWSQIKSLRRSAKNGGYQIGFLEKGLQVADNVVYVCTSNHALTRARRQMAWDMGFGIREMCVLPWPQEWRKLQLTSGFDLVACWWSRGWGRTTTWTEIKESDLKQYEND